MYGVSKPSLSFAIESNMLIPYDAGELEIVEIFLDLRDFYCVIKRVGDIKLSSCC